MPHSAKAHGAGAGAAKARTPAVPGLRAPISALSPVGLRAFFRMGRHWGLKPGEQCTLLACSRSSLRRWRTRPDSVRLHRDTIERISCLLSIQESLGALSLAPTELRRRLRAPREGVPFFGRSILDTMLGGNVSDLLTTQRFLEHYPAGADPDRGGRTRAAPGRSLAARAARRFAEERNARAAKVAPPSADME